MNRQELIEHIAKATGETKAASGRFLDAFLNTIQTTVAAGERVSLVGFGSFETVSVKERRGYNPQTGTEISINATVKPKFIPGSNFKELVRGNW